LNKEIAGAIELDNWAVRSTLSRFRPVVTRIFLLILRLDLRFCGSGSRFSLPDRLTTVRFWRRIWTAFNPQNMPTTPRPIDETPNAETGDLSVPSSTTDLPADLAHDLGDTSDKMTDILERLPITASFEELATRIPEVRAMVGMDQRSDFHSLTLDEHTKELVRQLAANPFIAGHPKRDAIILAGNLHDVGKTSPDGQQVHPKDPNKRQYVGHEKESARMIADILPRHFVEISDEDKALIIGLAGLHASALNLLNNFTTNNQPKGKELGSYDDFVAKVEQIPGTLSLEEKLRIIFSLNRADKLAGYNPESDRSDPKVAGIIEKSEKQVRGLDELEKALPVLIQAIIARRGGQQDAGIVCEDGVYKLREKTSKPTTSSELPEAQVQAVMAQYGTFGLQPDQKVAFEEALRNGGVPSLGKAGFGRAIGAVRKIVG